MPARAPHLQNPIDQAAILDGLPAHIALLAPDGTICAVNEPWRRFATENGLMLEDFYVGSSYFAACDHARGDCATEAAAAAAGIRRVLAGEAADFTLQYPCHSPDQQRWFQLLVTPVGEKAKDGAIVMHLNITERVCAETALQQSQELLQMASRISNLGAWQVTLPDETLIASDRVRQMLEIPADFKLTLKAGISFFAREDQDRLWNAFRVCRGKGQSSDLTAQVVTYKRNKIWVRVIGEGKRAADGTVCVVQGAFQDISATKKMEESLVASESRFRQLAESMPMIVFTATADGEVDYSNRYFSDFTGIPMSESAATRWQESLHPDDLPHCLEVWQHSVANGEAFDTEYRIRRHSDNSYRWFHVQATPIRDESGGIFKWYGTAMDIDRTKRLEEESTALADRLTTTFDSMTDALVTFDLDWRLSFLNREAEQLLQQDRDHLLGQTLHQLFPDFAKSIFEPKFREALEFGKTTTFEVNYKPLNTLFAVRAYPSKQGLTVYFRDITAERQKDLRLREQAALLDKAKDAIILRDLEHHVLYWNRGAERIYGWKADDVTGKVIAKYLYADPATFYAATEATIRNGEWTGELEHTTSNGTTVVVDANWTLLRDDSGKPTSILAINTDVSERKKLEASIYRAQRMESIGTLASGIAHDLNNLLAPIVMGVELLKDCSANPSMEKVVATIEASAKRGTDLVKQVLSFAKGVDGARVPVNIGHTIKEVESIAHNTFPKDVSFESKIEINLPMILGDPTQLNQVLLNLCVNARDAMPDGGLLQVSVSSEELLSPPTTVGHEVNPGKYVRVDVADTGCGMSKAAIDRIFEPFFTTKELGQGTGLGLSTALGIIRSHNGFISVSSEPGKGSTFSIYIPVHGDPYAAEPPKSRQGVSPVGNGQLILLVDDEEAILSITQQTLDTHGYRTMTADDGAQAVALYALHHEDIAAVLTDMMMPVIDGPTLIAALYKINPKVKIIAASGLHSSTYIAKAGELGVQNFLAKPYSANQLLQLIHTTLKRD